jgi:hypothetical protein
VYCMRNVLRAKVDILVFIQKHGSDVFHNMVDKFGGRERRHASRRSRTPSMVFVRGRQAALISGASLAFPFALRRGPKHTAFITCFLAVCRAVMSAQRRDDHLYLESIVVNARIGESQVLYIDSDPPSRSMTTSFECRKLHLFRRVHRSSWT